MVHGDGCQPVPAGGGEPGWRRRPTGRAGVSGRGHHDCIALPDPSLCEPGLLCNRWDGRVHQGVGFDEQQGFIWETDRGFIIFSKAMLCTTARPERKTVCVSLSSSMVSKE